MSQDENTRDWALGHRTSAHETGADIVRPFGEYWVFAPTGVGLTAAGWASGNDRVKVAGERVILSIGVSAVIEGAAKYTLSRRRPASSDGWNDFEFFSRHSSMPSGHATVSFALAKSLSDDIDRRWASIGLYSLAVASSWARIYDDMHWLSDLGAGAIVGYYSAKFVGDRLLAPEHLRSGEDGTVRLTVRPAGRGLALAWRY